MSWTTILPLVGVILAPLLTYIVAVRRSSGKIQHTEAATLWEEAEKMRAAYREEADSLRTESAAMRTEMTALRIETAGLREQAILWRTEAAELRLDATNCKSELAVIKRQLKDLRGEK